MTANQLSLRALNRATLDRQLLLRPSALTARQAITHLTGLQAQAPLAPYVGLWTRLAAFRPDHLENLLTKRDVLRAHLMRNTVHLVDTADFLRFRPLFQAPMNRALTGNWGRRLAGLDPAEVAAAAAALLAQTPLTRAELGRTLARRWPDHDPAALAHAASHLLTLVQVPPRGLWRQSGPAAFMLATAWLAGRSPVAPSTPSAMPAQSVTPAQFVTPTQSVTSTQSATSTQSVTPTQSVTSTPPTKSSITPVTSTTFITSPTSATAAAPPDPLAIAEELVLRYLAAFGPASVADIQMWSGLTRLREVTERLGGRLRPWTGPDGAALLDLADAPAGAGPDTPAPPRFLPEYDNLLLSYAERSRLIPHRRPVPLPPGNGAAAGTLLIDGFWQADWKISRDQGLEVRSFVPLSAADQVAVAAAGERLLDFAGPAGTARDVRFVRDVNG